MLADDVDAASVAFAVGYESASQFNREYSRLFGQPPFAIFEACVPRARRQFGRGGNSPVVAGGLLYVYDFGR